MRESNEFRKHTHSHFTKSIEVHGGALRGRANRSALVEVEEVPMKFSKLATFKSGSEQPSPKQGKKRAIINAMRGSDNFSTRIEFENLADLPKKRGAPIRLEKI